MQDLQKIILTVEEVTDLLAINDNCTPRGTKTDELQVCLKLS
jgi:hypothetical protein